MLSVEKEIISLLEKSKDGLSIQDIAKRMNLARQTTSKYLHALYLSGIVNYREVGRAKVFFLAKKKKFKIGRFASIFSLLFLVLIPFSFAQIQSHPLSEITPIDTNLDMFSYNITNVSYLGIGLTSPTYPLHISGDVYWTGTLLGGNVPWARLTNFPSGCPEGYVVKAVGSSLTCTKVQVEGMVNGSGTVDHIPVWTGTNTLGDSKIHQFGNSIIFEGDIDLNTHNLFGANQINASSFYQNGKLVIASGTAAGGDLSGTYPNPTVAKIRGITVSTTSPSSGQALVYDGTEYLPTGIIVDNDLVLDGNNRIYQINIAGTNREIKASDLACTDCVTLGIETTGNYVVNITGGTGILVSGTQGEGWSPIVTIDTNIVPRKDVDENIPGNWIFQNDLTVMKNLRVAGNITYVNISHINVNGSFVPYFNNIFSLGTSTNKWANIYGVDIRGDSVYSGGNAVLTTATSFSDTSSSDISVTGTYDNLNLQIKAGAVGTSEISQIGCNPGYALRVIGGGSYQCVQINTTAGVGNISGSGTATQVAFFTGTTTIGSDSNLYWDNTAKRLGIGTTTPSYTLDVNGDIKTNGKVRSDEYTFISGVGTDRGFAVGSVYGYNGDQIVVRMHTSSNQPQYIWIDQNNVKKFSIDASGNVYAASSVGIGTSSPLQELHIARTTGSNTDIILDDTTDWYLVSGGNGNFWLYDGTETTTIPFLVEADTPSNTLYLDSTGNVGIGTTNPDAKLDVYGASSSTTNLILSANYENSWRWRFKTIDRGSGIDLDLTVSDSSDIEETLLQLSRSGSDRPELKFKNDWFVINNGNVGIGTNNPGAGEYGAKLDVVGGNIRVQNAALGIYDTTDTKTWHLAYDNSGNYFFIDEVGTARHFVIKNGGNVGIGTSSPQAKLHVYSGNAGANKNYDTYTDLIVEDIEGRIQIMSDDGGDQASSLILSNENKHWVLQHRGPNNANRFTIGYRTTTGNTDIPAGDSKYLTIDTSGKVGIGTTSPSYKLDVSGSARVTNDLTVGGTIYGSIEGGWTPNQDLDMNGYDIYDVTFLHTRDLCVSDSDTNCNIPPGNSVYVKDHIRVGGNILGAGADIAEKVFVNESVEAGDVVIITDNLTVEKASKAYDRRAAGIISTNPSYVLAEERDGKPLALAGIVPTKVTVENGEIKAGDLLTTSNKPGYAMKCDNLEKCKGAIIGKAMENANEDKVINVLVMLG